MVVMYDFYLVATYTFYTVFVSVTKNLIIVLIQLKLDFCCQPEWKSTIAQYTQ